MLQWFQAVLYMYKNILLVNYAMKYLVYILE